jgi:hypothetical protein
MSTYFAVELEITNPAALEPYRAAVRNREPNCAIGAYQNSMQR